jgi:hypothetical protein
LRLRYVSDPLFVGTEEAFDLIGVDLDTETIVQPIAEVLDG